VTGPLVVIANLVFNPENHLAWTTAQIDERGFPTATEDYMKRLPAKVHLFSGGKSLCGEYNLVLGTIFGTGPQHWTGRASARCLVTSVERPGIVSRCATTNVTFLRLCRRCMQLSTQVWLSMTMGQNQDNLWDVGDTTRMHASTADYDYWKERGLNV